MMAHLAFLSMAAALGAGSGAVFAIVAEHAPLDAVGSVTGVGAVGVPFVNAWFPPARRRPGDRRLGRRAGPARRHRRPGRRRHPPRRRQERPAAFSVYLPTYLRNAYGLTQADAAARMAGFVVLAVVMRPLGGWLSDRWNGAGVLAVALGVVAVAAGVQAFTPRPDAGGIAKVGGLAKFDQRAVRALRNAGLMCGRLRQRPRRWPNSVVNCSR